METKHTPGPWRIEENECGCAIVKDGGSICAVWPSSLLGQRQLPYSENARLIAAAPDMYEAIVEFCRRVDAGEIRSKKTYATFSAILEKLT